MPVAQSPYRHSASATPGGAGPAPSQGYFQAQATHEIRSPSQRHQYPPAQYQPQPHHSHQQHQRHDSHPPPPATQPTTPYLAHNSIPQTPPIALPGQQQAQQRAHSTHSTPTPTSAQSQHPYGTPFPQGSPAPQHHQLPPTESRHQSAQPPASVSQQQIATPQSAHSQHGPPPFSQPSSPYQQKISSAGTPVVAQAHSSPNGPQQPQQHHRPSHPRHPSQSAHDSTPPESVKRRSTSEREHSMSISPKTRVGSLPSNASHRPSTSEGDSKMHPVAQPAATAPSRSDQPPQTPAKRKLDDRSMSPSELEHRNSRPPPGDVNGEREGASRTSSTAVSVPKVRKRWSEPPVWAQSLRTLGKTLPKHANLVLQKRAHSHINGQKEAPSQTRPPSVQESPDTPAPKASAKPRSSSHAQPPPEPLGSHELLGPWEASITGVKPYEEISKTVADFLFFHVINAQDGQEILGRGIEFEIEAKLGTLIDKDTNHRVEKFVDSECILRDTGRVAFKSSMTEVRQNTTVTFFSQRGTKH